MTSSMAGGARFSVVALAGFVLAVLAAGCAGTPASPEQRSLAERRFLAPFLQNTKVVCERLEVDISMNFHLHVSIPGVNDRFQRLDIEQSKALVEKTWRNLTGSSRGWFTVKIIEPSDPMAPRLGPSPCTTYTVMNEFKLRIRERGEIGLSARAFGRDVVVEEVGRPPQQPREYTIADGVVKR